MAEFKVRKNVTQHDLAQARRNLPAGYRRDVLFQGWNTTDLEPAESAGGDSVYMSATPRVGRRRPAVEVIDSMNDRRLRGILARAERDPAWFETFASFLRDSVPGAESMTNEQIVRTMVSQQNRLSVERVFKTKGRDGVSI